MDLLVGGEVEQLQDYSDDCPREYNVRTDVIVGVARALTPRRRRVPAYPTE